MSVWRRKAIETFPQLRQEFARPETTIHGVFFELLDRARDAHSRSDEELLGRIYGFAHWCFRQRADDLCNAAGVAFFEHLVDGPFLDEIPRWVEPDVFEGCKDLFRVRLSKDEFGDLCDRYARRKRGS
jgi:hypothetical protein